RGARATAAEEECVVGRGHPACEWPCAHFGFRHEPAGEDSADHERVEPRDVVCGDQVATGRRSPVDLELDTEHGENAPTPPRTQCQACLATHTRIDERDHDCA